MVNTHQNYTNELNNIFFKELKIRSPDYNLGITTKNYGEEISDIIKKSENLESLITKIKWKKLRLIK